MGDVMLAQQAYTKERSGHLDAWGSPRRSVVVSLPRHTSPSRVTTIGLGLALAAAGAMHSNPLVYSSTNSTYFSSTPIVEKMADRRRRNFATASQALLDIRLWTGFAWSTLAEILNVSRRAVHSWASGQEPTGERLVKLIDLHNMAREYKDIGHTQASKTIAEFYNVDPKPLRSSARHSAINAEAIMVADLSPLEVPLQSLGRRKIRRINRV